MVGGRGEAFDEGLQFLLRVGAQTGDEAVKQKRDGDDGDEEGEEEARPATGALAQRQEHREEGNAGSDEHRFECGVGEFEDGDGSALIEGVGEDVAGFEWVEVVEAGEDGT